MAEFDGQGNKTAGHIYFNGMLLATEVLNVYPSAQWMIQWQQMDPVTGSKFTCNIQAGFWLVSEPDPLGAEVSSPPPEPEAFEEPPYTNAKMEQFWPIEIEGGRTGELDIGMAQYLDGMDMVMAREAWRRGERDRAQQIMAANPNVGISATGRGAARLANLTGGRLDAAGALTLWGAEAATGLGFVYTPQELQPVANIGAISGGFLGGGTPQDSAANNPSTIDNSQAKKQACQVSVSFTGSYLGLANGPSLQPTQKGSTFGIGFSVNISGLSGDIAVRSTPNDPKPANTWLIEQYVADHNVINGEVVRHDKVARMDELLRARPRREGNNVSWRDHPGSSVVGNDYFTNRDFYIKAYNGKQHCEVEFHMSFQVYNGTMINAMWWN